MKNFNLWLTATLLCLGFHATASPDSCVVSITFDEYVTPLQWGGVSGDSPGDVIFHQYGWPVSIHHMASLPNFLGTAEVVVSPPSFVGSSGSALLINALSLELDVSGSKPQAAFIPFWDGNDLGEKELIVNGVDVLAGIGSFANNMSWTVGDLDLQIGVAPLVGVGYNQGGICIYGPLETIRLGGDELYIDDVCFGSFAVRPGLASSQSEGTGTQDCESFVDFDQAPYTGAQWSASSGLSPGDLMFEEGGYEFTLSPLTLGGGSTTLNKVEIVPGPFPAIVNDGLRFDNAAFKAGPSSGPVTDHISFFYSYGGGVNMLELNSVLAGPAGLPSLWNGLSIGGVAVQVDWAPTVFGEAGEITLSGPIETLVLGGQELWIDNLCIGEAQSLSIQGCTNPLALNYDPFANVDIGTCTVVGVNPPPATCVAPCNQYLDFDVLGLGALWQEPTLVSGMQLFDLSGFPVTADVLRPVMDVNGDGVLDFTDGPGSSFVKTVVSPWPMTFGPASGIVLRTANAAVKYDLSSLPNGTVEVCFSILDMGGIDNLAINGSPLEITSYDLDGDGYLDTPFYGGQETLNGATIGGVNVIASTLPYYLPSGQLQGMRVDFRLLGDVDQLVIGGQEYFVGPLCVQEGTPTAVQSCQGDFNDDGAVGVDDLLSFLGVYGDSCD